MTPAQLAPALVRHRPLMLRAAARVVGESDAEDVVQDAVILALGAADRFRAESAVATWLYRITRNTAILWARKCTRRRVWEAGAARLEGSVRPPGDEQDARDVEAALAAALSGMPACRADVMADAIAGFGPSEIAKRRGRTVLAVKNDLHRARNRVRECLA